MIVIIYKTFMTDQKYNLTYSLFHKKGEYLPSPLLHDSTDHSVDPLVCQSVCNGTFSCLSDFWLFERIDSGDVIMMIMFIISIRKNERLTINSVFQFYRKRIPVCNLESKKDFSIFNIQNWRDFAVVACKFNRMISILYIVSSFISTLCNLFSKHELSLKSLHIEDLFTKNSNWIFLYFLWF